MTNLFNLRHAFSVNLFLKRVVRILTMGVPMHASRFGLLLAGGRSFRRDPYLCQGVACIFQILPWISIGVVNCSFGKTCVIFLRFSMLWLLHRPSRWFPLGGQVCRRISCSVGRGKGAQILGNPLQLPPRGSYFVVSGMIWAILGRVVVRVVVGD